MKEQMTQKKYVINKFKNPDEHKKVRTYDAVYTWMHNGEPYRMTRLASIIGELRKEGWNIITHRNHTYKGVAHTIYEHVPEGDDIKETKSNWMMPEWG
jgi:hypothetical protein